MGRRRPPPCRARPARGSDPPCYPSPLDFPAAGDCTLGLQWARGLPGGTARRSGIEEDIVELTAIDALTGLRAALAAPEERRLTLFREAVMEPLRPFWEPFLGWMP